MTKQEITEGLNCCQDVARSGLWACSCIRCPYRDYKNENDPYERCQEKLLKDAEEALLNAMPPRLLTLEEVKERDCGWAEDKEEDKLVHIVYEIRNSCIAGESIDGFDAQGHYIGWMCNIYGKHRRLWSDKPTEEQRKATPWDK